MFRRASSEVGVPAPGVQTNARRQLPRTLAGAVALVAVGLAGLGTLLVVGARPLGPAAGSTVPTSSPTATPSIPPSAEPSPTSPPDSAAGDVIPWWPYIENGEDLGPLNAPTPAGSPTPGPKAIHHVPVLTYHVLAPWSVASAYSLPDLDVSPERFEAELVALRDAGWRTITAAGLSEALATGKPPPSKTCVISIDDGFDDGYTYALPLLQRYGFTATYFIVAGRMDQPPHLSWDQARALAAAGMEIGNHTLNHLSLSSYSRAEVSRQVAAAQDAILEHLGVAPVSFAYPFGDFNSTAVAAVQAAGLQIAFTTQGGTSETWAARFTLPRIHVGATLLPDSMLRVMATYR